MKFHKNSEISQIYSALELWVINKGLWDGIYMPGKDDKTVFCNHEVMHFNHEQAQCGIWQIQGDYLVRKVHVPDVKVKMWMIKSTGYCDFIHLTANMNI